MAIDLTSWTVSSVLDFLDIAMALVIALIIYYLLRLLFALLKGLKGFHFPSFGGGSGDGGSSERGSSGDGGGTRRESSSDDKGSRDTPKEEPKLARIYGNIVNSGGTKLISKVTLKKDGKVVIEANFNGA